MAENTLDTYKVEDILVRKLVRKFCGYENCGQRTANGAPWAMPCTLKTGHEGRCEFHDPRLHPGLLVAERFNG